MRVLVAALVVSAVSGAALQCSMRADTMLGRRSLLASGAAVIALPPFLPASADVRGANQFIPKGEKEINDFLRSQGFKPLPKVNGLSPLVQYIGAAPPANIDGFKAKERSFKSTLLVRFLYPSGWLVETPTVTENGEAGKIAANNYQKGDSADFVAMALPQGESLGDLKKDFFKTFLGSQMSNDVYEDMKVKKLSKVTADDGTELVNIDFTYKLLTRAGFTVDRKGVATAMVASDSVVALVLATTAERFKNLESDFRGCADSFRANAVKRPDFVGMTLL